MRLQRFGVGFISALIFPLIKMVQSGTVVQIDGGFILGLLIPPFLLGVLIGFYAVIVENKEDNMARLFRICIALPAFVMNLAGGEAPNLTQPAHAADAAPAVTELKCEKKGPVQSGIEQAWASITGTDDKRFWWVKKIRPKDVDKYVMVEGEPWWVLGMSGVPPEALPYYDTYCCSLVTSATKQMTQEKK